MSRIGIPRALGYFLFYPFWHVFFTRLGHEVEVSPPTTRAILDAGISETVNEACIPIKIYHGHVDYLKDKVDVIFSPRLVSLRSFGDFGTETFCPKFLGLPDMIRSSMKGLPPVIDTRIDLRQGGPGKHFFQVSDKPSIEKVCIEVGSKLGHPQEESLQACAEARKIQDRYMGLLQQAYLPEQAMAHLLFGEELPPVTKDFEFTVAVLGYPYCIYDKYVNVGLLDLLARENVKVLTQDMVPQPVLNRWQKPLAKDMFWYFSNRAVAASMYYATRPEISGIIHVTAFACGPDSIVDRTMEWEVRKAGAKPFLPIMIDEQTGEAGLQTRIEAFVDMLRYQREGRQ